jgi:hypothetical protein
MKKYGQPKNVVTDGLCSYPGAMNEIGNADRHEVGRRLNNRAENSHQPFRQRERAMQRFRSAETLQKFSSVHAHVHNHFNQERHLVTQALDEHPEGNQCKIRSSKYLNNLIEQTHASDPEGSVQTRSTGRHGQHGSQDLECGSRCVIQSNFPAPAFDAGDRRCGLAEMLEAEHRTEPKLDGSMILLWLRDVRPDNRRA